MAAAARPAAATTPLQALLRAAFAATLALAMLAPARAPGPGAAGRARAAPASTPTQVAARAGTAAAALALQAFLLPTLSGALAHTVLLAPGRRARTGVRAAGARAAGARAATGTASEFGIIIIKVGHFCVWYDARFFFGVTTFLSPPLVCPTRVGIGFFE